ncbi:Na+/H+ antiporter subunit C [Vibrio sp. Isolate25]|uniref:Na+/H+ antiporter subunit C n=1 Tax=Vibrio TaxID=662 RepID=UPI001EFC4135|nr:MULTISPECIES: Na+/H+ antiporter subunit C [Vibrio]MCG9595354.1 Na+/H+ antiporter subunit C [Vibrio sp. Isolate25]MCG9677620.1 Na+/H+ antiporter subunit C [Vibrio sp. Isolate24]USD34483.1 Na+/H+ antiporter subunit C [Vibrio sp. SCSIO 43186]USD47553.1 Na+/H+ antiporter subunit C [Vibrio sp. SCSIO 43145]USD71608.1 Na+/H+ antiporter subunit C [Vibrio sp. SCSIO 43139]
MEILWSLVVGVFVASGIYLMLERHILRLLFGLILLSSAVNIAIFTAGRLTPGLPPLIDTQSILPPEGAANPLPQALILTAIVIGFGLLVFALMLFYRAYSEADSADIDAMQRSEEDE